MASTTKLVELFNADAAVAAAATTTAFVEAAYANLLNLSGDFSNKDERVGYWVGQINSGEVSKADFAATFLAAAAVKGDLLTNAEFAANTETLAAIAKLDEATLTTLAEVQAGLASSSEGAASDEGQTFTLTTGVDALNGTSGSDVFIAADAGTDTQDTVNVGDSIDGAAGTDTLRITFADNDANPITLSNVENVELIGTAATGNISAQNWSGVEKLTLKNAGVDATTTSAAQVSNLSSNAVISLENVKVQNDDDDALTIGYAAGTLGTTGAVTINTDNVGAATRAAELVLDTNGSDVVTSATIAAAGATVLSLNAQADADVALTSVTVSGEGALTLTETANAEFDDVETFNASANTGGVTADLSTSTEDITVTGGSGNDSFTVDLANDVTVDAGAGDDVVTLANPTAGNLSSTTGAADSIKGGEGTDILALTAAGADALDSDAEADRAVISEFEGLRVTNDLNGTTINLANISGGVNTLQVGADITTAAATVNGFTSGATVEFRDANATAATQVALNIGMTGATGAGTTDDTLNLMLNDDLVDQATAGAADGESIQIEVGVDGINKLNVTTADRVNTDGATGRDDGYTLTLTNAANVDTITVDGDRELSFTSGTATDALATFNAADLTGDLIVDLSGFTGTQGVTVTGGAGTNTLTGTTLGDIIKGGDRADTITGGNGADTLTGGAGADTFVFTLGDTGTAAVSSTGGSPATGSFDSITDFAVSSDVIDFGAQNLVLSTDAAATAGVGVAAINAEGFATFNAADDTLAEKVAAVNAGLVAGTEADGHFAIFEHDGNSYIFVMDDDAGDAVDTADALIQLTGVTGLTDTTVTGGDLTIA